VTLAQLILALCDFADSHPQLVGHEVACRSGADVVQLAFREPDGSTFPYVIGVEL
jgi:hypothetical protein